MRPTPMKAQRLIKSFEACELQAYRDVKGVWTVGWGNTVHAKPGLTISQAQADAFFREDLANVERDIARALKPEILQRLDEDEYGALCSFAFNLGVRPQAHQIWSLINSGQFDRVPARLLLYNKASINGKLVPVAGLTRRRRAEAELWQTDGEEIRLTASAADVMPTVKVEKKLRWSKRLWLGITGALTAAGSWVTENALGYAQAANQWAQQLQHLVAPQMTYSEFLGKVAGGLAVVSVASGVLVTLFQAKAHKDAQS